MDEQSPATVDRERPWFERHLLKVLGGLSTTLMIIVLATRFILSTDHSPNGPLKAEGLPPLPVQQDGNTASRARPSEADDAAPTVQKPRMPTAETAPLRSTPKKKPQDKAPKPTEFPGRIHTTNEPIVTGSPLIIDASKLIFGTTLVCVDGVRGVPRYAPIVNRYLSGAKLQCNLKRPGFYDCRVMSDNKDFAQAMVAEGYALPVDSDGPLSLSADFARSSKRGLWETGTIADARGCTPVP